MRVVDRRSTTIIFNKLDSPVVEFPLGKHTSALSKRTLKSIRISRDDDTGPVQFLLVHEPFVGPPDGAQALQVSRLDKITWSSDAQRELIELKFTQHGWDLDVAPDSGVRR